MSNTTLQWFGRNEARGLDIGPRPMFGVGGPLVPLRGTGGKTEVACRRVRTMHNGSDQWAKLWDARTLDAKDLVVEVGRVNDMKRTASGQMYERSIDTAWRYCSTHKWRSRSGAGWIWGFLREIVIHDRADERGLVVVAELSGYGEFVGRAQGPTSCIPGGPSCRGRTCPKVVLLQCEIQSRIGGRSMISSGAAAYRYFQQNDPESLALLRDPRSFPSGGRAGKGQFGNTGVDGKAVFDEAKLDDGRVWLTFRFDGEVKLDIRPDPAGRSFRQAAQLLQSFGKSGRFRLEPNQILICDNTSIVTRERPYQAGSGRKLNRLQLDGTRKELVFGFPTPN